MDWEVIEASKSIGFRTSGEQKTIGPFYKFEEDSESRMWAIPPLLSHETWKDVETEEWDILYPLVTYDRFGSEFRLQLFQSFSFSGGINQESEMTKRLTLFPFYFQQRSEKADNNYTALFPIYGHLENRFFRKEIDFLLFPLYLRSEKSAFETRNFLYPIFIPGVESTRAVFNSGRCSGGRTRKSLPGEISWMKRSRNTGIENRSFFGHSISGMNSISEGPTR